MELTLTASFASWIINIGKQQEFFLKLACSSGMHTHTHTYRVNGKFFKLALEMILFGNK